MKILLLSDEFPPDGPGGDSAVVENLALQYRKHGHDVFVVAATPFAKKAGRDVWKDIPVLRIYADYNPRLHAWISLWNIRALGPVQQALKEFKPDIVHAHGVNRYLSYRALVLAHKSGARVYLTAHDAMLYHFGKALDESRVSGFSLMRLYKTAYNPFRNILIRLALKHVQGVIAVSESLARALRANGIPIQKVIHNGIDSKSWHVSSEATDDFKKKYDLGNNVILFGGRLSGLKGAFMAIECLANALREVPDTQLCVIGTKNSTAEQMLKDARRLGVEKNVIFTGRISDEELKAAYYAAAVVIMPSFYVEPFGMMALEAMVSKRPVVGSNRGGIPEIIQDRVTGFVANLEDVAVFENSVIRVLKDKRLATEMGDAGYSRAVSLFSLEKQAKEYLSLFSNG